MARWWGSSPPRTWPAGCAAGRRSTGARAEQAGKKDDEPALAAVVFDHLLVAALLAGVVVAVGVLGWLLRVQAAAWDQVSTTPLFADEDPHPIVSSNTRIGLELLGPPQGQISQPRRQPSYRASGHSTKEEA